MCVAESLDLARDGKIGVHLDGSTVFEVSRLDVIEGPSGRRRRNKAERARIAARSSSIPTRCCARPQFNEGSAPVGTGRDVSRMTEQTAAAKLSR